MRSAYRLLALCSTLLLTSSIPALASPHVRRGPTAPRLNRTHAKASTHAAANHGSMASERATQIQAALIKAGYLTGTPSGTWDAQSQAAMEKLQADNGWQTRIVPDSRAIIKLGLGPNSNNAVSTGNPPEAPQASTFIAGDSSASRLTSQ